MKAVKIGEEGSASMATNNRKLSIEDYLDLIKNRDHQLNSYQLRKVVSVHGFRGNEVQKSILLEAVKTINLIDLRRSTLKDSSVSADACLTMTGVINDLNDLQWQECHVTSLITQGASATATKDRTVPVNRKKSKLVKVEAEDSIVSTTNTIDAVSNTTVVKFNSLEDLVHKPVEVAADGSIIPTPGTTVAVGSTTVSGKRKKSKGIGKKPVEVAADDSIIPITIAAGSTTVSENGKKSKGLGNKPVEVAANDSIIPTTGTTVVAGSTTVSEKGKQSNGLGKKPVEDAADDSTISTESTTDAAGGTIVSVKRKRLKETGMKSVGCTCC